MTAWTDYGPAEFDRRRCPRGAQAAPAAQAGLFVMARTPLPAPAAPPAPEMDGQGALDLFGEDSGAGSAGTASTPADATARHTAAHEAAWAALPGAERQHRYAAMVAACSGMAAAVLTAGPHPRP